MKAVLFDAFGTLVEITDKRNPFYRAGARRDVMTENLDLGSYTDDPAIHRDLAVELQSMRLYDDVIPTLDRLRGEGILVGIASNLARPYGEELMRMIGAHVDMLHYSYLEGRVKPDPQFFISACRRLGLPPSDVTMVGDNYRNDYCGAVNAGLNASMIVRPEDTLESVL